MKDLKELDWLSVLESIENFWDSFIVQLRNSFQSIVTHEIASNDPQVTRILQF